MMTFMYLSLLFLTFIVKPAKSASGRPFINFFDFPASSTTSAMTADLQFLVFGAFGPNDNINLYKYESNSGFNLILSINQPNDVNCISITDDATKIIATTLTTKVYEVNYSTNPPTYSMRPTSSFINGDLSFSSNDASYVGIRNIITGTRIYKWNGSSYNSVFSSPINGKVAGCSKDMSRIFLSDPLFTIKYISFDGTSFSSPTNIVTAVPLSGNLVSLSITDDASKIAVGYANGVTLFQYSGSSYSEISQSFGQLSIDPLDQNFKVSISGDGNYLFIGNSINKNGWHYYKVDSNFFYIKFEAVLSPTASYLSAMLSKQGQYLVVFPFGVPPRLYFKCFDANCGFCSQFTHCIVCKLGFFSLNGVCVCSNIASLTYIGNFSPECMNCTIDYCQYCVSHNICYKCLLGFFLTNNTCKCLSNSSISLRNTSCIPCNLSYCSHCEIPGYCYECFTNFQLVSGDCYCVSPYSLSVNNTNTECIPCNVTYCKQCRVPNHCFVCSGSNFVINNTSGLCQCSGYILYSNCYLCSAQNCLRCNEIGVCTICENNYILLSNGICTLNKTISFSEQPPLENSKIISLQMRLISLLLCLTAFLSVLIIIIFCILCKRAKKAIHAQRKALKEKPKNQHQSQTLSNFRNDEAHSQEGDDKNYFEQDHEIPNKLNGQTQLISTQTLDQVIEDTNISAPEEKVCQFPSTLQTLQENLQQKRVRKAKRNKTISVCIYEG